MPLVSVAKDVVGPIQVSHSLVRVRCGRHIRVILPGQTPVRCLDDLLVGRSRHLENEIRVLAEICLAKGRRLTRAAMGTERDPFED
jgi:hypothetical protein